MEEIYPDIFLIKERGSFGIVKPPENIYVIAGKDDGLIFDAGYGNRKTIRYVIKEIKKIEEHYKSQNKEFKLTRIMPSHAHPDHFSGLKPLRKKLGLKVLTTKKAAEIINKKKTFSKFFEPDLGEDMISIRTFWRRVAEKIGYGIWRVFYRRLYGIKFLKEVDEYIEENTEISINNVNWKIFHSPGHSPDHISLYNEEEGILFAGDNVLRSITTWLGPPHCVIDDYVESVKEIQNLSNLKTIFPAHGSPVENPQERINEILEHRRERTQQVIDLVYANPETGISPLGIVKTLYPNEKVFFENTARGWICLTLKKLERDKVVRRVRGKKKIWFYPY